MKMGITQCKQKSFQKDRNYTSFNYICFQQHWGCRQTPMPVPVCAWEVQKYLCIFRVLLHKGQILPVFNVAFRYGNRGESRKQNSQVQNSVRYISPGLNSFSAVRGKAKNQGTFKVFIIFCKLRTVSIILQNESLLPRF